MDDRKNSLQNKVALVTGSSRGIGDAIAIRFAQAGARVVVHGRDAAAIADVRKQIVAAGGTAMQVTGDVTRFAEIETMRQQIEGAFGPVDILVANAGASLTRPGPLEEIVAEQAGPFGIRVNCIAPETILTERNEQQIPDATKQELVGMHPIKRLGTPEDVAEAALFLASDQAGWITGVILDIAGGSVLR